MADVVDLNAHRKARSGREQYAPDPAINTGSAVFFSCPNCGQPANNLTMSFSGDVIGPRCPKCR